jgi:hypothetical protein
MGVLLAAFQLFEEIVQVEVHPDLYGLAVLESKEEYLIEEFYVIAGRGVAPKFTFVGTAAAKPRNS